MPNISLPSNTSRAARPRRRANSIGDGRRRERDISPSKRLTRQRSQSLDPPKSKSRRGKRVSVVLEEDKVEDKPTLSQTLKRTESPSREESQSQAVRERLLRQRNARNSHKETLKDNSDSSDPELNASAQDIAGSLRGVRSPRKSKGSIRVPRNRHGAVARSQLQGVVSHIPKEKQIDRLTALASIAASAAAAGASASNMGSMVANVIATEKSKDVDISKIEEIVAKANAAARAAAEAAQELAAVLDLDHTADMSESDNECESGAYTDLSTRALTGVQQ